MWMDTMENKRIKIKQGVNWKTLVGTILFVTTLAMVFCVKFWMPDHRPMKNGDMDQLIKLDSTTVKIEDYRIDPEKKIGEILMSVRSKKMDHKLNYGVSYDGTYVYSNASYDVIESSVLPGEEDDYFQEVLIQFDVPDEWYYISILIGVEDYKQLQFTIDYRTDHLGTVDIKGKDYLKTFDEINVEIVKAKKTINELENQINGYDKTIQTQSKKIGDLEVKIKTVLDEATKKEKQAVIDMEKKALAENEAKKKESEDKMREAEQALDKLEETKNAKR